TWLGRESAITPGPRSGTLIYTKGTDPNTLEMRIEGSSEGGGAYKESGKAQWNEIKKTLTVRERLAAGVEVSSVGDWSSPIGLHFEFDPVAVQGPKVRL